MSIKGLNGSVSNFCSKVPKFCFESAHQNTDTTPKLKNIKPFLSESCISFLKKKNSQALKNGKLKND